VVGQQQRSLAEVVDEQGGHGHAVPRQADGPASEVAHVRIEGLAPGDAQDHRAQDDGSGPAVVDEESDRVARVQGGEHRRDVDDLARAQPGQDQEPQQHDRAEDAADAPGSLALKGEEQHQHGAGGRDHEGVGPGGDGGEALQGGQHRDGRGDESVAVEQGRAEQGGHHDPRPSGAPLLGQQGEEGHDAALALVVRAHDKGDVLDADHRRQGPEYQGEHAQDVEGGVTGTAWNPLKHAVTA
jgi:hypothetical protein